MKKDASSSQNNQEFKLNDGSLVNLKKLITFMPEVIQSICSQREVNEVEVNIGSNCFEAQEIMDAFNSLSHAPKLVLNIQFTNSEQPCLASWFNAIKFKCTNWILHQTTKLTFTDSCTMSCQVNIAGELSPGTRCNASTSHEMHATWSKRTDLTADVQTIEINSGHCVLIEPPEKKKIIK